LSTTPHPDPPTLHSFPTRRSSDLHRQRDAELLREERVALLAAQVEPEELERRGRVVAAALEARPGRHRERPARDAVGRVRRGVRSEEHTSELQSRFDLVCRLLLEK